MHIYKIRLIMYKYSLTCCGRFCCHHDVIQVYIQYTKKLYKLNSLNYTFIIYTMYHTSIIHN
jgi:hypothetical protein